MCCRHFKEKIVSELPQPLHEADHANGKVALLTIEFHTHRSMPVGLSTQSLKPDPLSGFNVVCHAAQHTARIRIEAVWRQSGF